VAEFQERVDKNFMGETREFEDHYWWFKGLRYFTVKTLERMPEFQQLRQKSITILDAGCGTGANIILLSRYGKVFGLDFLEECARQCQARRLSNVCRASITSLPFKNQSFDLVGSFDVLICLDGEKDVKALRELYNVCRPGGLFITNLAAFDFLRSGQAIASGEIHRYTRNELKAKLEQVGFKVLKLTYRNMFLFPVLLALRMIKNVQRKATSDFYVLPAPINSFFYGLIKLETWLSSWFNLPFGSSIFSIAQKPYFPQCIVGDRP
jgi:SAM-dependent methyltransferase